MELEILNKSGEINDKGTNAKTSYLISEQKKNIWMMNA
jgi:DNA-binding ferritin-like protein